MGILLKTIKCERCVIALGIEQSSNEVDISGPMDLSTSESCEQSTVLLKHYLKWKHKEDYCLLNTSILY